MSTFGAMMDEITKIAKSQVATGMKDGVQLYDHQQRAVDRIAGGNGSLLLSHGTGSGKTITAIAAFEKMRDNGDATRALVVAPSSLRVNFLDNGIKKFTNARGVIFGNAQEVQAGIARSTENPDDGARYHVVSYDMFRKDPENYIKAAGADTVIYDELHRMRNEEGVTAKTIKEARKHHKHFIGLTGSIMNNTPGDLVPLVDAMTEGEHRLGSKTTFERRFVKEDNKGNRRITNSRIVRGLLKPYVDHFETKDLSDKKMPKKIVQDIKVMMSPEQAELYRYTVNKLDPATKLKFRFGAGKIAKADLSNIFSKIIKSRQVSNAIHTINLDLTTEESAERTPKVKKLLDDVEEHLKETSDGQVVVHSNLIFGGVDVLRAGLKKRGFDPAIFIGKGQPGVSEATRQTGVKEFNDGKKKVIIISAAGGEGLDLKNATMFSSLDGHFNPERIQQAEARAVRAGGLAHRAPEDRRVIVRRYMSVVPRSITQAALDTMDLFSPSQILKRALLGAAPVVYNPFKREQSPDEWVYGIAEKKNKLNEEFRQQLQKTSSVEDFVDLEPALDDLEKRAFALVAELSFVDELEKIARAEPIPYQPHKHIKSDSHIMDHYWENFGGQVEDMEDPQVGELKNRDDRVEEQRHVEALKAYYAAAVKGGGKPGKGIHTDKDHWKRLAKTTLVSAPLLGATLIPQAMVRFGLKAKDIPTAFLGTTLGSAALVGTMGFLSGRKMTFFTTPKTHARKRIKFSDENLRSLLRGLPVIQEEVKKTEHYIPGSA